MRSNVGPTKVVRSPPLRKFDLLPACFRQYFKEAWTDFDFEFVRRDLNKAKKALGRPLTDQELAKGVEHLRDIDQETLRIEAFAVYGSDHPQAMPVPRVELRRRGLLRIFDEGEKWRRSQRRTNPGTKQDTTLRYIRKRSVKIAEVADARNKKRAADAEE